MPNPLPTEELLPVTPEMIERLIQLAESLDPCPSKYLLIDKLCSLSTAPVTGDEVERVAKNDLQEKLCGLHARLSLCWENGTGEQPPRRPHVFEPQWADLDTLLDAAMALSARTPQLSEIVTPEMIEAGREVYHFQFDETYQRLYLKMHTARTIPTGDEVERGPRPWSSTMGQDPAADLAEQLDRGSAQQEVERVNEIIADKLCQIFGPGPYEALAAEICAALSAAKDRETELVECLVEARKCLVIAAGKPRSQQGQTIFGDVFDKIDALLNKGGQG